jgi:diketogulonate reductase-like aldo/keto reductase
MNLQSKIKLHTGNQMPILGLGTWQLTRDTADTVVDALKMGYPMIDTSGDYGTQPGIAEALKRSDRAREDVYVVTKVEEYEDAYKSARRNVDELGLEFADLILIHRPPKKGAGEDLWKGLIRARDEGITRDIGVSNYSVRQMEALEEACGERPAVNQIEWSPFGYSKEMYEWCKANEVIIQAYSPLTRRGRLEDDKLEEIAREHGKTVAQVLIRWNLQHGVVPLPKANSPEHLRENLDVFDFVLREQADEVLDKLNGHYSALGSLPYLGVGDARELVFRERLEAPMGKDSY